ncbi:MAG TPA: hypothetical protein VKQ72_02365, partial [Aggregatilineales bacterium]|nr:hypothetical protein [Aggregatilineales bacterium]
LSGGDVLNVVILAAASALESGQDTVGMGNFVEALDQVRRAKHEVGRGNLAEFSIREGDEGE